jgi:hypothetical protein
MPLDAFVPQVTVENISPNIFRTAQFPVRTHKILFAAFVAHFLPAIFIYHFIIETAFSLPRLL